MLKIALNGLNKIAINLAHAKIICETFYFYAKIVNLFEEIKNFKEFINLNKMHFL